MTTTTARGPATPARYITADMTLAFLVVNAFLFAATLSTGALIAVVCAALVFTDLMSDWTRPTVAAAGEWLVARRARKTARP